MQQSTFHLILIAHLFLSSKALNCGFPGLPIDGRVDAITDWHSNAIFYPPGETLTYSCSSHDETLRGTKVRTCQDNGIWSGYRPFCEQNVAYGKNVTYDGPVKHRRHHHGDAQLLTDGYTAPEDQECFRMAPGSVHPSTVDVDLEEDQAVNSVIIYLAHDEASYLLEDQVTLPDATTRLECTKQATSPAPNVVIYRCLDGNEGVDVLTNKGRTVRFQHKGGRSVSICEVKIYANPIQFHCGLPEAPANGKVEIKRQAENEQNYLEMAQYECDEGYQLSGPDRRVCYGRHWHSQSPTCVKVSSDGKEPADQPVDNIKSNDMDSADVAQSNESDNSSEEDSQEEVKVEPVERLPVNDELIPDWAMNPPSGDSFDQRMKILPIVLFVLSGLLIFLGVVLTALFFCYYKRNDQEAYQSVAVEQVEHCTEDVAGKESHPLKVQVYWTNDNDPDPSGYITRAIKKVYQSIRKV